MAIFELLDVYIPIAGTTLLVSLLLSHKKNNTNIKLNICIFSYIFFIIISLFGIKEILIPYTQKKPSIISAPTNAPEAIVLKEFDQLPLLSSKKGMILQNDVECLVFGTIAQQNPTSYLAQKMFFRGFNQKNQPFALFAEYAKIIDKKIILYKATIFINNKNTLIPSNSLAKNYILPLSFEINPLFDSWNTTDLRNIRLLPIITHNAFSQSFVVPIILAIAQYILSFITLCIISSIGIALKNSLSFKELDSIGSLAILICSYPFTLLLFYYLSLLTQVGFQYFIKI